MAQLPSPPTAGGKKRSRLVVCFVLLYVLMTFILYRSMSREDKGTTNSSIESDGTHDTAVVSKDSSRIPLADSRTNADSDASDEDVLMDDDPDEKSEGEDEKEDVCSKVNRNADPNHTNAHVNFWRGLDRSTIEQYRGEWRTFVEGIPPHPPKDDPMNGRGIVLTAGNRDTFERALTAIKNLRYLSCTMPIEVWHLPDELPSDATRQELETYGAVSRDLSDKSLTRPIWQRTNAEKQFQIKAAAIINSRFQEVLYLDSDNSPTRNPSFLFDTDAYRRTGALFWPDFWKTHSENKIFEVLDIPCADEWEQESGQIVVDKARAWRPLQLAYYMQEHHDLYFQFLNGDKDTFKYAWKALDAPYHMVEVFLSMGGSIVEDNRFCGHTMLQYMDDDDSEEDKPLFVHANLMKITHKTYFLQADRTTERPWNYIKRYNNTRRSTWLMPYFYVSPASWRPCMDFSNAEGEPDMVLEPFDDILAGFQTLYFQLGGKGGSG